ncbi:PRC-barrel domain-containing protein [Paenibacillus filicis]|uniref:PRC-barrel domain-containing protein n=1 Tax=Paenibacillus gyeongsangnamensis TaxID=3388067 RepID=A0ABT4QD91_9BACL|nr:PRC-barrel domain-containing protein [Paenibacillus filicis]MCZ8514645.1 PRC-barrel domain-containing protein [Paenibacillus filicis]
MKRARDIIGLPVLCVQSGKQSGIVKDMLIGSDWNAVALLLETKSWFSEVTCIEWDDIVAVGDDAVTIDSEEVIRPLEACTKAGVGLLSGDSQVRGLPVITVNGQQLGVIEDVYLDPDRGKQVIGYELTEGFISDLKEGRKWLPMPESVRVGEDAVIVPVHASEALEEIFVPKEE